MMMLIICIGVLYMLMNGMNLTKKLTRIPSNPTIIAMLTIHSIKLVGRRCNNHILFYPGCDP